MFWHMHPENSQASPVEEDLDRLEEFLKELPDETATVPGFLREHLAEMRYYLRGAMPAEYDLEVKLAETLVPGVEDEGLRKRLAAFLKRQHASHFVEAGLTHAA